MKAWLAKKLIQISMCVLDSWVTGTLTDERALAWRRHVEDATIGKGTEVGKRAYWKKKGADDAFVSFMRTFLKSTRIYEYSENKTRAIQ